MPAYAQMTKTTARSDEQQRADRDADRAYRAMMKQVSDKPRSNDPWAGVRNRDAAVAASPMVVCWPVPACTKKSSFIGLFRESGLGVVPLCNSLYSAVRWQFRWQLFPSALRTC